MADNLEVEYVDDGEDRQEDKALQGIVRAVAEVTAGTIKKRSVAQKIIEKIKGKNIKK
jgi:hypothetical protein